MKLQYEAKDNGSEISIEFPDKYESGFFCT